jgi:hypothetical protein
MGINIRNNAWTLTTFTWHGIDWTARHVMWRLEWIVAALVLAAVAAIPFDRFDTSRALPYTGRVKKRRSRKESADTAGPALRERDASAAAAVLTPLDRSAHRARFAAMVIAEWKLIVRGLRWWYVGPLGLTIAAFVAPLTAVHAIVLPFAWFWPILLWSKLGTREATYNTEPLFFSAPHPLSRQLAATWLAGVILSVFTGFAVALRLAIAGDAHGLLAWCVGAAFIPALALALGVWTRSGKAFEAIYTGLCYLVIQQASPLDFMGAVTTAPRSNPIVFSLLTVALLVLALWGRQRRLRN